MIRFNNDYNHAAHPAVLEAIARTASEGYFGYGEDALCERAAALIRAEIGDRNAAVHFLVGGTQTNAVVIDALLRPYQGVIAADTGHIAVHEGGAIEANGHKVLTLPHENGKLSAEAIRAFCRAFWDNPVHAHMVMPGMVYLSQPTEFGTLYSLSELSAIRGACRDFGLFLYVDGARMAYGLAAAQNDVTLADLARLTDAFYIGGTKCGALFGEALVFPDPTLLPHFFTSMKQHGAVLAKGWLLGAQFCALFENGLYAEIGAHAVSAAMQIRAACLERGLPMPIDSPTNQQFAVLTEAQMRRLEQAYVFEPWEPLGDGRHCVRFCTSWSTAQAEADALAADLRAL